MFNKIQKTKSFKGDYTLFKLLTFTMQQGSCRVFTPTALLSDWNHVIDINVINGLPVYLYACIQWWIKYFLHIWGLWSKSQSTEAIWVHIMSCIISLINSLLKNCDHNSVSIKPISLPQSCRSFIGSSHIVVGSLNKWKQSLFSLFFGWGDNNSSES